ncbi:T-cell surface glycoprotein CD3 zeta chain [Mixophyes fleayi]|uniref:T-cell surface glycoprotein CD3 zeta chain n=1 Tax=Mixophyes fleayi TaxID=3061075 RepID=UPI003F4DEB50
MTAVASGYEPPWRLLYSDRFTQRFVTHFYREQILHRSLFSKSRLAHSHSYVTLLGQAGVIAGPTTCAHGVVSNLKDAQVFGWTDPRICYILDGILFLYAIIITGLLFRERLMKKPPVTDAAMVEDSYDKLNYRTQDNYDVLNTGRGGQKEKRGQKTMAQDKSHYAGLQRDKMNDPYSDIGVKQQPRKKGRGSETVYQDLSGAPRDTYDALQMQALH